MSKKKIVRIVIILLSALLIVGGIVTFILIDHYYRLINYREAEELVVTEPFAPTPEPILPIVEKAEPTPTPVPNDPLSSRDVYNILLLGTDARWDGYNSRTDTMMLVSINKKTKQISLVSFLRDTYIWIHDYGYQRLNVANIVGGPGNLIATLEENYGVKIDNYAFVNFYSFMDVVDVLGGVDVAMSNTEVYCANEWVYDPELQVDWSRREAIEYNEEGLYHLTGIQALAFCRTRSIAGDTGRTEQQRRVITALWDKVRDISIADGTAILTTVLPQITSDISMDTCIALLMTLANYHDYTVVQQQIPADGTFNFATIAEMSVVQADFEANQVLLQELLYGES